MSGTGVRPRSFARSLLDGGLPASQDHAGPELSLGNTRIQKLHELDLNDFHATQLLPALEPDLPRRHPEWAGPDFYDATSGKVFLSVHTWVVRHNGKVLLIDTGVGNDRSRPGMQVLDHLNTPYLEQLAACGLRPEQVDYVLLTHIHADHVGWNTHLRGSEWLPTFPNAEVLCSDLEWRYGLALSAAMKPLLLRYAPKQVLANPSASRPPESSPTAWYRFKAKPASALSK